MVDVFRQLASFDPAEFERVTGLSMALQRDWRRRRYLAGNRGKHASFSLYEAAEVLLMKSMSSEGFGPATAKKFANAAAESIVWFAMMAATPKIIGGHVDRRVYKNMLGETAEIELITNLKIGQIYKYVLKVGKDEIFASNDAASGIERCGDRTILCRDLEVFSQNLIRAVKKPLATIVLGKNIEEYRLSAAL